MISLLLRLGVSGGMGVLGIPVGMGIVVWVQPTTDGGAQLLIFISIATLAALGLILASIFGPKAPPDTSK